MVPNKNEGTNSDVVSLSLIKFAHKKSIFLSCKLRNKVSKLVLPHIQAVVDANVADISKNSNLNQLKSWFYPSNDD